MPVYEYECKECDKIFEMQQRITDDPLQRCPNCQGEVKKIISMTSFQLKGGGWYADGYGTPKKEEGTKTEKSAPACESAPAGGCAGCPAATATS
ncbi:MAG TPA: zinc ribbon domain-containing protein [Desulfopila sp.]|nr:zinc ribbon domain-containing protein [Desulfopila sp.]